MIRWRSDPPPVVVLWHDYYQSIEAGPMSPAELAAWAAGGIEDDLIILDAADHRRVVGHVDACPAPPAPAEPPAPAAPAPAAPAPAEPPAPAAPAPAEEEEAPSFPSAVLTAELIALGRAAGRLSIGGLDGRVSGPALNVGPGHTVVFVESWDMWDHDRFSCPRCRAAYRPWSRRTDEAGRALDAYDAYLEGRAHAARHE